MNFVSPEFWLALTLLLMLRLGILACFVLVGKRLPVALKQRFDRVYLLLTSIVLFALEDVTSLLIFLGVSTLIFSGIAFGRKLPAALRASYCLCISIIAVLPLLFFKYAPLIDMGPRRALTFDELLIPIGLSFYTFQLIALFVDDLKNYEDPITKQYGLIDLANFASFFPQIVAGPIERGRSLLPQIRKFSFGVKRSDFVLGIKFIVIGAFYKLVIADSVSEATPWIHGELNHPLLIHMGNIAFGIRIYGDFCGYSFIALGLARIFGIRLTLNFRSPYTQRNIQHFWRSWHVSLTNWFRDYIYMPLGGNKWLWSVLIVFALSGVWHGAGWGFLIWGLIHGVGVAFVMISAGRFKLPAVLSWGLTILFVSLSWLPFYQWESDILLAKAASLITPSAYFSSPIPEFRSLHPYVPSQIYFFVTLLLGMLVISLEGLSRWCSQTSVDEQTGYLWALRPSAQCCMISMIILFSPTQENGFIYFNF